MRITVPTFLAAALTTAALTACVPSADAAQRATATGTISCPDDRTANLRYRLDNPTDTRTTFRVRTFINGVAVADRTVAVARRSAQAATFTVTGRDEGRIRVTTGGRDQNAVPGHVSVLVCQKPAAAIIDMWCAKGQPEVAVRLDSRAGTVGARYETIHSYVGGDSAPYYRRDVTDVAAGEAKVIVLRRVQPKDVVNVDVSDTEVLQHAFTAAELPNCR